MAKKKKQKQKLEIVFNNESRREFLTGFHKRKVARKKRAKDELSELLKVERKRIRQQVKDSVNQLKKSYEPVPEVQHLLNEEEYENDAVQVKIVELSADTVSRELISIGENKPKYCNDEKQSESEDSAPENAEEIPGMSTVKIKTPTENKKPAAMKIDGKIKCKKDLDKITKKKSNQTIRSNKLFKMKAKLDSAAGKKQARKERRRKEKTQHKVEKRRGKGKFNKRRR